jgi:hypothetical protein
MNGKMERNGRHQRSKEEAAIIAYLLGRLPGIESDHFEQRYLEEPALFAEMMEIEDELIDDYAAGALSNDDRIRFEQHFLQSPERRKKVRFAIAMTERAVRLKNEKARATSPAPLEKDTPQQGKVLPFNSLRRPVPAWRQWGAIAAVVLIAITAGAVWLRNRQLHRELIAARDAEIHLREQARQDSAHVEESQTLLENEKQRSNDLESQVRNLSDQVRTLREQVSRTTNLVSKIFITAEYFSQITRGGPEGKVMTVRVPRKANSLTVQLEFPASAFEEFSVALLRTDGSTLWVTPSNLKAQTKGNKQRLVLTIPTNNLVSGNYKLLITSGDKQESVGRYSLKVVRFQ